jgi:uncharacterized membrane protein SpoIIM required for sporulation
MDLVGLAAIFIVGAPTVGVSIEIVSVEFRKKKKNKKEKMTRAKKQI